MLCVQLAWFAPAGAQERGLGPDASPLAAARYEAALRLYRDERF
jgi:hypothetical protein